MKTGAIDISFNHCGMTTADFWEMEKQALKKPTYPYSFSNEPWADAFFEAFKAKHSTATYFKDEGRQYVCLDERARKRLLKQLKDSRKKKVEALAQLDNLINEVETGEGVILT